MQFLCFCDSDKIFKKGEKSKTDLLVLFSLENNPSLISLAGFFSCWMFLVPSFEGQFYWYSTHSHKSWGCTQTESILVDPCGQEEMSKFLSHLVDDMGMNGWNLPLATNSDAGIRFFTTRLCSRVGGGKFTLPILPQAPEHIYKL